MRRPILATFLVVGLTEVPTLASRQGGRPGGRDGAPPRLHAPGGRPRHLVADPTPGFARPSLFDDYANSSQADDQDGLRAMIDKGELVELEAKAPVQVLRNLAPSDAREPGRRLPGRGPRPGRPPRGRVVVRGRIVGGPAGPEGRPSAAGEGILATIAATGTIALSPVGRPRPGGPHPGTATEEAFRLDAGVKVVVLERRGRPSGSGSIPDRSLPAASDWSSGPPSARSSRRLRRSHKSPPTAEPQPPASSVETSQTPGRQPSPTAWPGTDATNTASRDGIPAMADFALPDIDRPRRSYRRLFCPSVHRVAVDRRPPLRPGAGPRGCGRGRFDGGTVRREGPACPGGVLLRLLRQRDQGRGGPRRP